MPEPIKSWTWLKIEKAELGGYVICDQNVRVAFSTSKELIDYLKKTLEAAEAAVPK